MPRVKIPSTIRVIPGQAFRNCHKLRDVELLDGVQEIGQQTFYSCGLLERINVPPSLKIIGNKAFQFTGLLSIDFSDGIEDIGMGLFLGCKALTKARFRPLNKITASSFQACRNMFSLELPEGIILTCRDAFAGCYSLRNLAIPPNSVIEGIDVFDRCKDLLQLFGSKARTEEALIHRFDDLPIHKLLYYQSYHSTEATLEHLTRSTNLRVCERRALRTKLNPSGNQQDCLGMTPLHILACSTRQSIEPYQMMIEK